MKKYYYTIGEVSNMLDVKPHVIRYWEGEFPVLRPKKAAGRIRKYSEDHILLLRKIHNMLYVQRFTIEGARQKLKQERSIIRAIADDAEPEQLSLKLDEPSHTDEISFVLNEVRKELDKMKTLCKQHLRKY
ncbi:MAG: MerR family transcriptional regulator [Candidatus Cloacimonetes bacterium]|nr:MerR family transcriptional regulator [Candidatus Cloacimonadota bacterium]